MAMTGGGGGARAGKVVVHTQAKVPQCKLKLLDSKNNEKHE
ncbi:hypothetical protein WG66_005306, partial [Moniliophthora roreri]